LRDIIGFYGVFELNRQPTTLGMKKQRYHIAKTMGAALLIAASWRASGQSADAIVNKLVQKGVLTQQEADDLRKHAVLDKEHHLRRRFPFAIGGPNV
jgi:hypothetical protein